MTCELIPDAIEGSAPGLDIKGRLRRAAPSEGAESAHSVAVTYLSGLGLEGVPIAEKMSPGKFKYLDKDGNIIAKGRAMEMADGIIYYQGERRLRQQGAFVAVDKARSVISGSRASNRSDVANLRDLDGFRELPAVPEEGLKDEMKALVRYPWSKWLLVIVLFVVAAGCVFEACGTRSDSTILELFNSEPPESVLQRFEQDAWHDAGEENTGIAASLSGPLSKLLSQAEKIGNDDGDVMRLLLGGPLQASDGGTSEAERKSLARAEVGRILGARKISEILGKGGRQEQRDEFNRIVRLLHPDKGLVSQTDDGANLALRLALAAHRSLGLTGRAS